MRHRLLLMILTVLLSGCGGNPDRAACTELVRRLQANVYGQSQVRELQPYTGQERGIRYLAWYHREEVRTIDSFLRDHPNLEPATQEVVQRMRDASDKGRSLYEKLISENRLTLTDAESLDRDRWEQEGSAALAELSLVAEGSG